MSSEKVVFQSLKTIIPEAASKGHKDWWSMLGLVETQLWILFHLVLLDAKVPFYRSVFMTDNGFYFGQFEKDYFFIQVAELEDRFLRSVGEKGG